MCADFKSIKSSAALVDEHIKCFNILVVLIQATGCKQK
jgi:hypothetical protein